MTEPLRGGSDDRHVARVGGVAAIAGALASRVGGIGPALAVVASAGVLAAVAAFLWLPETKGRELEAIAPEAA